MRGQSKEGERDDGRRLPGDLIHSCSLWKAKSGSKSRLPPALRMAHEEMRYEGSWRATTQTSACFFPHQPSTNSPSYLDLDQGFTIKSIFFFIDLV